MCSKPGPTGAPDDLIPLCVPYTYRQHAASVGARWDGHGKRWQVKRQTLLDNFQNFRAYTPRMFRPDRTAPFISPLMVPSSSWGKNLRSVLSTHAWDVIRKAAYARTGRLCIVCGGKGSAHPVEADEVWGYDLKTQVQTLVTVASLCPDCHAVRHWGKTQLDGAEREAEVKNHLAYVNGMTLEQTDKLVKKAIKDWEKRNKLTWTMDYSWAERTYGYTPSEKGYQRAEAENAAFKDLAKEAMAQEDTVPTTDGDCITKTQPTVIRPLAEALIVTERAWPALRGMAALR